MVKKRRTKQKEAKQWTRGNESKTVMYSTRIERGKEKKVASRRRAERHQNLHGG
jgi:hypothetical protein